MGAKYAVAFKTKTMKYILILLLFASCAKEPCSPPEFEFRGNVVYFQTEGEYTIEVQGLDNPYHGFIKFTGKYQAIQGADFQIRVKNNCSEYSQWKRK